MTIFLDGDSLPRDVRDIVYRAGKRLAIEVLCYSDRSLHDKPGEGIVFILVERSPGAVDDAIAQRAQEGDVVITRDIPFAARLLEKGVSVINHLGDVFTRYTIRERLSIRDAMLPLYQSGLASHQKKNFDKKDAARFANGFDRLMTGLLRKTCD